MKCFVFCFLFVGTFFGDDFTFENTTSFRKIAIEWASSAKMVQESNDSLLQNELPTSDLFYLNNAKTKVFIPKNAAYFRVLVWQTKQTLPDLLTNWVDIVPGKTYFLKEEHLTPILLMNGMGC